MTIPVQSVVDVSIALTTPFPARAGFGTLNIVAEGDDDSPIDTVERIRFYTTADGVAADWPAGSEVLKAATAYFSQRPRPRLLKVSTRYSNGFSSRIRGGAVTDLTALLAVDDGSFDITIDGTVAQITAVDFTSDTTFSGVAATIQAELRGIGGTPYANATCRYLNNRFIIGGSVISDAAATSFLREGSSGTDISSLLQLRQGEGTRSDGSAPETITASLNAIQDVDADWYGLMFTKEMRDGYEVNSEDGVLAAAQWTEARRKVFLNTSNDLDVLDSGTDSDIASTLQTGNFRRTMTTFSSFPDQYPSATIVGRAFTVNFSQPNSTITLKFKQLPGITVENITSSQKQTLDNKNANSLIEVGDSEMFAESLMASGVFFDEVHGVDWLQNAIETNVFGYLLTRTTKVPYTNKGLAAIQQQVISALDEGVINGLIAPGETINGEFLPNGYSTTVIPVEDVNPSDKSARHYPGLSFVVIGAGAIHSVQINGVFER